MKCKEIINNWNSYILIFVAELHSVVLQSNLSLLSQQQWNIPGKLRINLRNLHEKWNMLNKNIKVRFAENGINLGNNQNLCFSIIYYILLVFVSFKIAWPCVESSLSIKDNNYTHRKAINRDGQDQQRYPWQLEAVISCCSKVGAKFPIVVVWRSETHWCGKTRDETIICEPCSQMEYSQCIPVIVWVQLLPPLYYRTE